MDRQAAANAIRAFLSALGHPAEGERAGTPDLVAAAWCDELLQGYQQDARAILEAGAIDLSEARDDLVILRNLHLSSICPHHLLPAQGHADLVYLPGPRLAGFGAIARALSCRSRRLVLQEQLGRDVAALLVDVLGARGAVCRLKLQHACMQLRGPRQHAAQVETLALAGCFADSASERAFALTALGNTA